MKAGTFFNVLDYAYIVMMVISTVVGVVKGFTRSALSTAAWILSGLLSVVVAPLLHKPLSAYITDESIVHSVSLGVSFIVLIVILLFTSASLSCRVKASIFSGLDRAAGSFFGLLRGMFIILLICTSLITLQVQDEFDCVHDSKISAVAFNAVRVLAPTLEKMNVIPKGVIERQKPKQSKAKQAMLLKITPASAHKSEHAHQTQTIALWNDVVALAKDAFDHYVLNHALPDDRDAD